MWFLTYSVSYRKAQIVFQTKIEVSLEVILYSPPLLPTSTSNQSKGKWIVNFRFVTNVNVPTKSMYACIPEKYGNRWVGTYEISFKEILWKKEMVLTFFPPVNGLSNIWVYPGHMFSSWTLLYLMSRWLKMVLHSCPLAEGLPTFQESAQTTFYFETFTELTPQAHLGILL